MTGGAAMPTHLPAAPWQDSPGMARIVAALNGPDGPADGAVRYVGGAVRDTLLGLAVEDVDLATPLTPDQVTQRLAAAGIKVVPTGIAHGTVTAVADGKPFEITTLRRDVATDGRRAVVAFSDDWAEDAARRDFTINALYADPASGAVFDYFGGMADLAARRVRFIGDAGQRIAEDHLRILRFYRFAARFGTGPLDRDARAAIRDARATLRALSRERVAAELLKLLGLPAPAGTLAAMVDDGVLAEILPEARGDAPAALAQLTACEAALGQAGAPLRRLAALLPADAALADGVAARLRLSSRQRARLTLAATPLAVGDEPRAAAYRQGMDIARDRWLLHADAGDAAAAMAALTDWPIPAFPHRGRDLIALGVTPGPDVAQALKAAEADWVAAGFPARFNLASWLADYSAAP